MDDLETCKNEEVSVSILPGVDCSQREENGMDNNHLRYEEKIILAPKRNEMFPMTLMRGKDKPVPDETCTTNKRQSSVIITPARSTNLSV